MAAHGPAGKNGGVLVVGSVNADLFVNVRRLPMQGETLKGSGGEVLPGGKGANQAVAAARMGGQVNFAGVFGNDGHGRMLRETMHEAGVNTDLSQTSAGPSGQAVILLEPDGKNSIVLVPGANADWPARLPSDLSQAISQASCVMLQREIPEQMNIQVAQCAKANGVSVFMDVGGEDGPLPPALLECIDFCCPNEAELQLLTGMPTETPQQIVDAVKRLQALGVQRVLVTLGEAGSMVFLEDGTTFEQGVIPVDRVVDTTGAGDCFRGAFAVALAEGTDLPGALKLGAAASSICIQREGAMDSMPRREDTDSVLRATA